MSAEGRVEHQKLNQTTALLLFGWVFGVQLDSLEKSDSPKTLNREEYYAEEPREKPQGVGFLFWLASKLHKYSKYWIQL